MKRLQKTFVITGGVLYILIGVFHLLFWKFFDWGNELAKLNEVNSNVMQMLNIGLIVLFLSFGVIMICLYNEIISTRLGKALLIFSALFFLVRLIEEFVFPGSSVIAGIIILIYTLIYLIPVFIKS
jgi:hypothetical protein